jgi:hypothetical protein
VVIQNLDFNCIAASPTKNQPPLIIDPDGVKTFHLSLQAHQAITRRNTQIPDLARIMQIQQFMIILSYYRNSIIIDVSIAPGREGGGGLSEVPALHKDK